MSYDNPDMLMYDWGQDSTFGATTVYHYIVGPKGKVGFVRDLMADITTAVTWSSMTAPAEIAVGISSGDATYGRYRLGTSLSTGYAVGTYAASNEVIPGNPPRSLGDFSGHVVLDGGPYSSSGIAGGSYGTQVPLGRIPKQMTVVNVVNGTGNVPRIYLKDPIDPAIVTGQLVNVRGVAGATGTNGVQLGITAISTANNYIETSGTFGGTYTAGGVVDVVVTVSLKQGAGGTPAGGGFGRVKIEWVGANNP